MMKYKVISLIIFLLIVSAESSKADDLLVAVLEQPQCKESSDLMVRVLFAKLNRKWIALDNRNVAEPYDFSKVTWTAALDGRNIGQVKTVDPKTDIAPEWTYPRDKLLQIAPSIDVPKIMNRSEVFSGWCNEPKFRPVVLVSQSNFKDPAGWKPFHAPEETRHQLFPEFKKAVGSVKRCPSKHETKAIPYDYQSRDLLLFKSYQNALGQKLISIGLDPNVYNCDGPLGSAWKPNWFVVDKRIRYVGSELSLVDAGDYDNDGKSEVIFWHRGYNEDGYSLFYGDFNSRVDFYWNYH